MIYRNDDDDSAIVVSIPLLLLLLMLLALLHSEKIVEKKKEVGAMVNLPYREANSVVPSVSNMMSLACGQYPKRYLFALP